MTNSARPSRSVHRLGRGRGIAYPPLRSCRFGIGLSRMLRGSPSCLDGKGFFLQFNQIFRHCQLPFLIALTNE